MMSFDELMTNGTVSPTPGPLVLSLSKHAAARGKP